MLPSRSRILAEAMSTPCIYINIDFQILLVITQKVILVGQ